MDFANVTWVSALILAGIVVGLELWIKLGPKGRRTETAAALVLLFGFLQTSDWVVTNVGGQLPVVMTGLGYVMWRLRYVTTTAVGQKK